MQAKIDVDIYKFWERKVRAPKLKKKKLLRCSAVIFAHKVIAQA